MESKVCTQFNSEKIINNFYKIYSECKDCNSKRGLKRYYENKINNSNKKKCEKTKEKPLQIQNNRFLRYKKSLRSYVELQNRIKAM